MQHIHTRGFMAPYHNVRYWLSDFCSGGKAVGKKEIFNQCHARLEMSLNVFLVLLRRVSQY